jgi:hypothetical protein
MSAIIYGAKHNKSLYVWTIQTPTGIEKCSKSLMWFAKKYNISYRTLTNSKNVNNPQSGYKVLKKERK